MKIMIKRRDLTIFRQLIAHTTTGAQEDDNNNNNNNNSNNKTK